MMIKSGSYNSKAAQSTVRLLMTAASNASQGMLSPKVGQPIWTSKILPPKSQRPWTSNIYKRKNIVKKSSEGAHQMNKIEWAEKSQPK
jgi:hypothetical protein